jgi:hypothetical protein
VGPADRTRPQRRRPGPPYRPSHCRPTCAVFAPSLRSPLSSITSTPPPCGAVAGSLTSSSSRRALTRSGSHRDSDKKNCSRCTTGCCAPVTGSAPASAVSVLLRSRWASSPARYSRNPAAAPTGRTGHQTGPHTPPAGPALQDRADVGSSCTPGAPHALPSRIPQTCSRVNKLPLTEADGNQTRSGARRRAAQSAAFRHRASTRRPR